MNKALVGLLALGAAGGAVTGTSALVGKAVRARLSQQTAALSRILPSLKVEEQIEAGLFSSTRTVKLRLGCVPQAAADARSEQLPIELTWRDEIQHGPFPGGKTFGAAGIRSELRLGASMASRVARILGSQPLLTAYTQVGLGGGFATDAEAPSIAFKKADAGSVAWSGLKAHVKGQMPVGAGKLTYESTLEPSNLALESDDGSFALSSGATHSSGSAQIDPSATSLVFPFESSGQNESVKLTFKAAPAAGLGDRLLDVTISKLTAKTESSLAKELWSSSYSMGGSLNVNGFAIDKLEIASALRRVHAPTYTKLMGRLLQTSLSCDADPSSRDPVALLEAMQDDFFALLSHDPEYAMGPIAVDLAGKRAEVSYRVGVRGITSSDKSTPLALLLPQKAEAHAEARADLGLIDEAAKLVTAAMTGSGPAAAQTQGGAKLAALASAQAALLARTTIDGFVAQGYLIREGDTIRATFDSVAGQLKLNGKPFAVPDLAAPAAPAGP